MMITRMAATINFIDGAVDNLPMIVFICFLFLFALYLFVCLHVCLFGKDSDEIRVMIMMIVMVIEMLLLMITLI